MTTVIGLLGPAGAGKSTVAAYLEEKYGAQRYSLAAPLKEIARQALDFTQAQVYGTQAEKEAIDPRYGFSARWFLQRLGTEGVRAVLGEYFWSEHCLRTIANTAGRLAVIEDVRFANEAVAIQNGSYSRGVVIRLHPVGNGTSVDPGTHASEREWREAVVDFDIRPADRGVGLLCEHVDDVMIRLDLRAVDHTFAL